MTAPEPTHGGPVTETNVPLRAMARRAVGYRKRIGKLEELLQTVLDRWKQAPTFEPIFDASRGKWLAVSPNNLRVVLAERDGFRHRALVAERELQRRAVVRS